MEDTTEKVYNPQGWPQSRLKNFVELNPSVAINNGEEVSYMPMECLRYDSIEKRTKVFDNDASLNSFEEGDIVMAKVTPCFENGNIAIAQNLHNGKGIGTSEIFVLRAKGINTRYLFYYIQTPHVMNRGISSMSGTGGLKRISAKYFMDSILLLPPKSYQTRISKFLDRKCADINNVLDKTKASIEEYKKLKQSVITKAVTKGIRGERSMKDSGSTWFGQIPNTWNANKLKYTFTIRKRIVGEDGHTVLAITQKGVKPKDMSNGNGQFAESYANYQIVHPGDFAMNHMDLLTGWVDISKYEGVTSPDYRVFTLEDTDRNCPSYFLYMMQMCYSNRIFYSMGQGVSGMGRWRLPVDMFNNFIIACPPLEEQQEIAEYLDKKCSEIDSLITSKEKFITELESYKKSLIYEYVTGKKEVPSNI